ncbi:colanic acid biosynthesis glycosyltransferase WcaI (plasmid) [Gemmobacter aquarius]|uniref:Colanic acid biosynthesis glycosyltransferase WcaI n=1 Tax=Paragemmobacter aquarius TaxID=2169400 RepID=A0A2S0USD5_9RHOB|nr:colanic acid biosynthesis glycosyltransferase WcaI [Gemmobacter aquarius]
MRILLVGINYSPEIISIAVYSSGMAEFLAKQGHTVEVVTAHPYFPEWRAHEGWGGLRWLKERVGGVDVTHCPIYIPGNPSGVKRILHHASFAISSLPVLLSKAFRGKYDVVFVVAPSLVAAPIGALAARLSGAKAWLHVQDFEVEAAFATGLISSKTLIGRVAVRFERWSMRFFDRVSTISPQMRKRLIEKGVPQHETVEFRNWSDLEAIKPLDRPSSLKAELGLTEKKVVLYSGNLGKKQGLEAIVRAAEALRDRKDIVFVIAGDGPLRPDLERLASGLSNVIFIPLQPYDRLSDLLGMASVHVLPQMVDAADLVLPSKLINMLASGRPIVATAMPHTGIWDEVQGAGAVVPPGDAVALAQAITGLVDDPSRMDTLGKTARARAIERWDISNTLSGLQDDLRSLVKATPQERGQKTA